MNRDDLKQALADLDYNSWWTEEDRQEEERKADEAFIAKHGIVVWAMKEGFPPEYFA